MDREVRELERAVASGDEGARLPLARALDRAGRGDEIFQVLLPVARDLEARKLLARFPSWDAIDADAGATRFLDVPPLREKPELLWATPRRFVAPWYNPTPLVERNTLERSPALLVSSLGIVVEAFEGLRVIEPSTGEHRLSLQRHAYRAEALFVRDGMLVRSEVERTWAVTCRDLVTGARFRTFLGSSPLALTNDVLVASGDGNVLVSAPGEAHTLWSRPLEERLEAFVDPRTVLLASERSGLTALEARTGKERWSSRAFWPRLDAKGVVARAGAGLISVSHEGRTLWQRTEDETVVALSPEVVVVARRPHRECTYHLVERSTGEPLPIELRCPWPARAVAIARDVVYAILADEGARVPSGSRIAALTLTGEKLFEIEGGPFVTLALAPEMLVALTLDGRVVAYGRSRETQPSSGRARVEFLIRKGREDELPVVTPKDPGAPLAARLRGWTSEHADEGRTRFVDVAPLRKEPTRIVSMKIDPVPKTGAALLATPLAVVVRNEATALVLDPASFTTRFVVQARARDMKIREDVLLIIRQDGVVGWSLLTEEGWSMELGSDSLVLAGTTIVTREGTTLEAFDWPRAGASPTSMLWKRSDTASAEHLLLFSNAPWFVTEVSKHPTHGFSTNTCATSGEFGGGHGRGGFYVLGDELGTLMRSNEDEPYPPRDRVLGADPIAASATVIVARRESETIVFDRLRPSTELGTLPPGLVAIARDVIYVAGRELSAHSPASELWRKPLPDEAVAIAASSQRIFVLTRDELLAFGP